MASELTAEELEYQILHWDDDLASAVSGVSISFFAAASAAVSLRLLTRKLTKKAFEVEDFLITLALVCLCPT